MATVYIDSSAAGAADGTSWTDAYTTLTAAVTAKAATGPHQYLVASTHVEGASWATATTIDFKTSGWSSVISSDVTDDSYLSGAVFNNTSTQYMYILGLCYIKGVTIKNNRNISFQYGGDILYIILEDGEIYLTRNSNLDTIGCGGVSNDGFNRIEIKKSILRFTNSGQTLVASHMSKIIIDNSSFAGVTLNNLFKSENYDGLHAEIHNTDLNGCTQLSRAGYKKDVQNEVVTIDRCKTGANAGFDFSVGGINANADYRLYGDSGNNWGHTEIIKGVVGKMLTSTLVKRTGGAEWKLSNAFSYEIQSNLDVNTIIGISDITPACFEIGNYELDISGAGGATLTFYLIQQGDTSPVALTADEFWVEAVYPNSTDNALGEVISSTSISSSSETWTGTTGSTTKQQVSVTIPQDSLLSKAPVTVKVCLAKDITTGSDELFICPSPVVT